MLHRASKLCSNNESFDIECDHLKNTFLELKYPLQLINYYVIKFKKERVERGSDLSVASKTRTDKDINLSLPFKDQISANSVKRQMAELSSKIGQTLRPVFKSKKLVDELRTCESKPAVLSRQCVVYCFECDLCEANYVGFTTQHLHQRIGGHCSSAVGLHIRNVHQQNVKDKHHTFKVLRKCRDKFDCLVHEMLAIRRIGPTLNTQADSIKSKLFSV